MIKVGLGFICQLGIGVGPGKVFMVGRGSYVWG